VSYCTDAASADARFEREDEPGDPQASYLVHKLRGTGSQVGGTDALMPPDGQLDEAEVLTIEAWITNGANDD